MVVDVKFRVVRIGGSLLTWDGFVPAFTQWMSRLPPARNVLIAGGGPWVELIRQAAGRFDIADAEAHLLCLQAMSLTSSLVGELLACPVITSYGPLHDATNSDRCMIFDARDSILDEDTSRQRPLPSSWSVTSDSIAARVAWRLKAAELVLLKSCDCPIADREDRQRLSRAGYVDDYFPTASRELANVKYVNLRSVVVR